jgi:S1-C subfamily serine protease
MKSESTGAIPQVDMKSSSYISNSPVHLTTRELFQTVEISADYSPLPGKQYHTGTGFFVFEHNLPYLVTARHMFPDGTEGSSIRLYVRTSQAWTTLAVKLHFPENDRVDVAVLTVDDYQEKSASGFVFCDEHLSLGDEGIFLGYPYGLETDPNLGGANIPEAYAGRVVPFAKRATFSGVIRLGSRADDELIVLDGMNNEGFSGGPLIFSSGASVPCVAGVVVAYRNMALAVYDEKLQKTVQSVKSNTGLIYAVPAGAASRLIEKLDKLRSPSTGK